MAQAQSAAAGSAEGIRCVCAARGIDGVTLAIGPRWITIECERELPAGTDLVLTLELGEGCVSHVVAAVTFSRTLLETPAPRYALGLRVLRADAAYPAR